MIGAQRKAARFAALGLLCIVIPVQTSRAQAPDSTCATGLAEAQLDVNNVRARLLNNGMLFREGAFEAAMKCPTARVITPFMLRQFG